jgi:hypothetical protein
MNNSMASMSPSNLPPQYLAYKQSSEAATTNLSEARVGTANCFSGSFKNLQTVQNSWTGGADAEAGSPKLDLTLQDPGKDNATKFWSRFSAKQASSPRLNLNSDETQVPTVSAELSSAAGAAASNTSTPSNDAMSNFDRLRSMAEQSVRKPELPEVQVQVQEAIVLTTPPSVQSLSSEGSSVGDSTEPTASNARFANILGSFSNMVRSSSKKQETKQIDVEKLLKKRDQAAGLVPRQEETTTTNVSQPHHHDLVEDSLASQIGDLEREMGLTTVDAPPPPTPQLRMDGFDDVHEEEDDVKTVPASPSALEKLKNAMPTGLPNMASLSWSSSSNKESPKTKLSGAL